jgi:hypothetical protein
MRVSFSRSRIFEAFEVEVFLRTKIYFNRNDGHFPPFVNYFITFEAQLEALQGCLKIAVSRL